MGDGASLAQSRRFERGNAAVEIDLRALGIAGIDMGDTGNTATAGIEIGVEHAGWTGKLQLGPISFANLETWFSKMLAQLIGRHSIQGRMIVAASRDWRGRSLRLGLDGRGRSAGRDEQGGEWDEKTHRPFVAAAATAGKLAGTGNRS